MRDAPNLEASFYFERVFKMALVAILVDGGFYQKRARYLWGMKTPAGRAKELNEYCLRHLYEKGKRHDLYRIFYYDCPPMSKKVYHPLTNKTVDFSKTEMFKWMNDFLESLKQKRKFALRMGQLASEQAYFTIQKTVLRKLCRGEISVSDLTEDDFEIDVKQKGVDMKIGLDISSIASQGKVDRIVLISGDSDFVPAAKMARRAGIDFVLDSLWAPIKPDLFEHIDGWHSCTSNPKKKEEKQKAGDTN